MFVDAELREDACVLQPEEILFLYTDGATEARCNAGFLGEEGLVDIGLWRISGNLTPARFLDKRPIGSLLQFFKLIF